MSSKRILKIDRKTRYNFSIYSRHRSSSLEFSLVVIINHSFTLYLSLSLGWLRKFDTTIPFTSLYFPFHLFTLYYYDFIVTTRWLPTLPILIRFISCLIKSLRFLEQCLNFIKVTSLLQLILKYYIRESNPSSSLISFFKNDCTQSYICACLSILS